MIHSFNTFPLQTGIGTRKILVYAVVFNFMILWLEDFQSTLKHSLVHFQSSS